MAIDANTVEALFTNHAPLDRHEILRGVFEFRARLQQLWDETAASSEAALEQLCELCAAAQAGRSLPLKRFAQRLATYVPAARSMT